MRITFVKGGKGDYLAKFVCDIGVGYWVTPYHLERGLMISGWSQMKVGLIQFTSIYSPTSCAQGIEQ